MKLLKIIIGIGAMLLGLAAILLAVIFYGVFSSPTMRHFGTGEINYTCLVLMAVLGISVFIAGYDFGFRHGGPRK